jgi:hypothetical protein
MAASMARRAAGPALQSKRPTVRVAAVATKYKVTIEHEGKSHELEVKNGDTILQVALDKGA